MITQLSGNSRILLTVNEHGAWGHLYYPYPGLHQQLQQARLGLYDGHSGDFSWVDQGGDPPLEVGYLEGSNACRTRLSRMGLDIRLDDMVHPNLDLVIRRVVLKNAGEEPRMMRLFHYQSLCIGGSAYRGTAYWDDERRCMNQYKRSYHFRFWGDAQIDGFTCGEHTLKGLRGSYVDAEDGELEGNVISHGSADSVLQWNMEVPPGEERTLHIYMVVGRSRRDVEDRYQAVAGRDPDLFTSETVGYWNRWAADKRLEPSFDLSRDVRDLYRRSLFVMRDCASTNGAVIASPDSHSVSSGGDGYEYCWWRDGAYISRAMSDAGMRANAEAFVCFAEKCQEEEGFFLHRHFPDGYIGATWHPPPFLQIDQTASVIDAVHRHYECTGDLEWLLKRWELVRRAADFLMEFVDERGLPKPSFDLWEERESVNAYSVGMVVKGLRAAAHIGQALAKRSDFWNRAAERMCEAALEHLWNPDKKTFFKSISPTDDTIDASTLLVDIFPPGDPRYEQVVRAVEDRLWVGKTGGIARYEGDTYYGDENAWIICTLWLAQAHLHLGNIERCRELLEWVASQAGPGMLLAEQVDARTGARTGVTPLVWSHSTFIETVNAYSRRPIRLAQPGQPLAASGGGRGP